MMRPHPQELRGRCLADARRLGIRWWIFFCAALLALPCAARDVYFKAGLRTGGTGSEIDPWQVPAVKSAAVIDAKLRPLFLAGARDLRVHWGEGTFETWGMGDVVLFTTDGTHGFVNLAGWQHIGAGMGSTILKLVPKSGADWNGGVTALLTMRDDSHNFQVRDLTIDCNWTGFSGYDLKGVSGVFGRGANGLLVERCEIRGQGASAGDAAGALYVMSIAALHKNIRVTDCWVHSAAASGGANTHGITVSCNNHHTTHYNGSEAQSVISGNTLEGPGAIALGFQSGNVICRDNKVFPGAGGEWHGGIYCDTGYIYDSLYEANFISGANYGITFTNGWYQTKDDRPHTTRNVFRGNTVNVTRTGVGFTAYANPPGFLSHTVANPTVVTSFAPHGLMTGNSAAIALVAGAVDATPSIVGTHTVTVLSPRTFSIPVNITVAASNPDLAGQLGRITGPAGTEYNGFHGNVVENNVIRYTSGSTGDRYGLLIEAGTLSTNTVRNNVVDPQILTSVP